MIRNLFTEAFLQAMGWTLLHFVWQGILVATLLAALKRVLKNQSANSRYVAACVSLLLMFAFPVATLSILSSSSVDGTTVTSYPLSMMMGYETAMHATARTGSNWNLSERFSSLAPWLISGWFAGVLLLSFRMFGGWMYTRHLKNKLTRPIRDHWQQRIAALCREIKFSRPVRILESALVQAPMVVGWLRPVILIPASALTGLTAQQLETILLHELAHIRRYDYLVNLIQTAVEILLFYHPAVWWVSRQIRIERENCCDDWAVERCGDGIAYARALTEIETLRQIPPRLAMAIEGGSLLERIQRIVGRPSQTQKQSASWIAGVIALATVVILVAGAKVPLFPDETKGADGLSPSVIWGVGVPAHDGGHGIPLSKSAQESGPSESSEGSAEEEQPLEESEPATPHKADKSRKPGLIGGLASLGYSNLTVDELIALKDHGVTPQFVRELQSAGFAHPELEELIRTKDHAVDPEFIRKIHTLGYEKLELDEFIRMKDHGVDSNYIETIRSAGFTGVSVDQLIRLRDHGVDAGFIQRAKSSGFKNLSIDQLIRLRDSGVFDDAEFGGEGI